MFGFSATIEKRKTFTTGGYGDITPHTFYRQIFTAGLVISGVGIALYALTGINRISIGRTVARSAWHTKDKV